MENENKAVTIQSFQSDPVSRVVLKNCIPALIAMIMVMVYNLADTFFLGLTHNDLQVTAVSFAAPLFMIFMSLGTLFGIGGTSVISRAIGAGNIEYAKKVCSFCFWSCIIIGTIIMAALWVFLDKVTLLLGASEESLVYTENYLRIVIGCGIFAMLSNCFSSIVRTEGHAMKAMTGTLLGNLINIILDPIFILGFHWGTAGAAAATVIGNAVAAGYYILHFAGKQSRLSIHPKYFSSRNGILSGVLSIGLSASLANLLVSLSSMIVNALLSKYPDGDMLVAGYGVTNKIVMIVTLIGIGIGSGVQPFLGYCYGAGRKARLKEGIRFSSIFGLTTCFVVSCLCFFFTKPIISIFLTDATAVQSGVRFTHILMTTAWLIGAFVVYQNTLQAIGAAIPALLASVFRQGIIFLPALFIMQALLGVNGLLWAQPVADVLSLLVVGITLSKRISRMEEKQ